MMVNVNVGKCSSPINPMGCPVAHGAHRDLQFHCWILLALNIGRSGGICHTMPRVTCGPWAACFMRWLASSEHGDSGEIG